MIVHFVTNLFSLKHSSPISIHLNALILIHQFRKLLAKHRTQSSHLLQICQHEWRPQNLQHKERLFLQKPFIKSGENINNVLFTYSCHFLRQFSPLPEMVKIQKWQKTETSETNAKSWITPHTHRPAHAHAHNVKNVNQRGSFLSTVLVVSFSWVGLAWCGFGWGRKRNYCWKKAEKRRRRSSDKRVLCSTCALPGQFWLELQKGLTFLNSLLIKIIKIINGLKIIIENLEHQKLIK